MRLIFLGPPGAGKGTQAEKLAAHIAVPHVSTGDIFRQLQKEKEETELAREIKEFTDLGTLVPDELVIKVVAERIKKQDCSTGYILDGFPRTLAQANALDETLKAMGDRLDAALYFAVADEVVVDRLSGRRSCPVCAANYHVVTLASAASDMCEKCGAKLIRREDDEPETVKKRLEIYHRRTAPLIEYYRRQCVLKEIDGDKQIDEIFSELKETLGI